MNHSQTGGPNMGKPIDEHLEEEATKLGAREQVIEDLGLPPIYSQLEPTQRVSMMAMNYKI